MPAVTLTSLLEPARLADLAGMRSYARGAAYHSDGRVEPPIGETGPATALVEILLFNGDAGSPSPGPARYHERRVPTRSARVGMDEISLAPANRRSISE